MSYISSLKPAFQGFQGLQGRNESAQNTQTSINKESLLASESRTLDLNITTKEGDVVTLTKESFMDFSSFSYDKSGTISNGNEKAAVNISSRSMTLASGSSFTFSVQGQLSESELDDIESLISSLDEIMYEMASGDMDDAFDMAMNMDDFDSFSEYSADLNYSNSFLYEKETAWSSNRLYDEALSDSSGSQYLAEEVNSSNRLLDMMLEEIDRLAEREKIVPGKMQEPVDQLFTHHIEELTGRNDENESENNMINYFEHARKGLKENFNRIMQEMNPRPGSFRSHI